MAGAVHVEALVGFLFQHFVEAAGEELEIEHAPRQNAHRRVVRFVPGIAGPDLFDGRGLRREDDFVYLALGGGEALAYRERARDVRGVAGELAAGVDQHQVAGVQRRIVRHVVQHAGIGAAGDDRPVGGEFRAVAAELVQQLGLELELEASRACGADRTPVRSGRY